MENVNIIKFHKKIEMYQNRYSIPTLNLGKMWPIKEKEYRQLFIKWPNLVPYS